MAAKMGDDNNLNRVKNYIQLTVLVLLLLYLGRTLFVPLLFGLLVALICYPVCRKLENKGWKRSWSITLILTAVVILFSALLWLLSYELNLIIREVPKISAKLEGYTPGVRDWFKQNLNLEGETISGWFAKLVVSFQDGLIGSIKFLLNTTVSVVFMMVMIPIYASLFLYNRETFVRYIDATFTSIDPAQLRNFIRKSIGTYFHFVKGTFFVYIVVGLLNSAGLLALGIQHAIIYGMITAFMTIIPYVGIIISAAIPVTVAFVTKDSLWYPVAVVLVFTLVQYAEANIIFPKIVGTQLHVSTWATLVAMIAGSILWGVAGMILFIPLVAILKILSDEVSSLKPINILLNRKEGYNRS